MRRITIFTPTFNRASTLPRLYDSLKIQTSQNFLWLIVDDGSTDDTETMVKEWMNDGIIEVSYTKQANQGKSQAHNEGVRQTMTELFTCVDSDDFLAATAVERILEYWEEHRNEDAIGILAYKQFSDGRSLTTIDSNCTQSTLFEAYTKHHLRGDTMLVYKSDILKKYSFPSFPNEKFVPEAYLYDIIDQLGSLLILKEALYYCEYLEDGYSQNMSSLLLQNPKGYIAYIKQRLKFAKKNKQKALDTIRYTSICIASKENAYIRNAVYPALTILTLPFGFLLFLKRYKK